MKLRSVKPLPGERKEAVDIPPPQSISHIAPPEFYESTTRAIVAIHGESDSASLDSKSEGREDSPGMEAPMEDVNSPETKISTPFDGEANAESTAAPGDAKDDDSTEAVGKDEASKLDQDMMEEDSPPAQSSLATDANPRKVTAMFQKILSLGGGAGQVVVDVGDELRVGRLGQNIGPNARQPTLVHQGRMVRRTSLARCLARYNRFSCSFRSFDFPSRWVRFATYQTITFMLVQQLLLQSSLGGF